jgi:hypothetical protein
MPFAPVDPATREKVIAAYLAAKGKKSQNQIVRELREEGIRVSRGSVNNFVNVYKKSQSLLLQKKEPVTLIPTSQNNSIQDNTRKGSTNQENQDVDFSDQPFLDEATVENMLAGPYNPMIDGESGQQLLYGIEPTRVDISDNSHEQKVTQIEEEYQNQPQLRTTAATHPSRPELEEDTPLDLGIDYESSQQARLVKWAMSQKKSQQYERHRLSIHWKNLEREKKLLEREKQKFYEAEDDLAQRIYQVKDLLPIADEMKRLGLDFTIANSWLICVGEMAQRKDLDIRSASWKLAEDLKTWQELGGFEIAISNAKHQLELLDIAIEERRAAISTLVDLRKSGMTEDNIMTLTRVVNGWGNGNGIGFKLDTSINGHEEMIEEDVNN